MAALNTLWHRLAGHRVPAGSVLLVVDQAGWILDEVAQELRRSLPPSLHCQVVHDEWRQAERCTIHFVNRIWAWTDGVLDRLHPSNRLIGLWWHGRAGSPEPAMQAALRRLRDLHPRFDRVQVTGSIGLQTLTSIGVPASKIVVLPEGVNLSVFTPARDEAARQAVRRELGIPTDAFVVGSFQKDGDGMKDGATPKMIKGPDVLVDVLTALRAHGPVVALLPGPARGYVTNRLTSAEVPFVAPGFVARAELPRLYHALDMYLSPSRDEGGPAGVLESMGSGVPVVSTRTGMPADIIEDGVNGGLVEVDDVDGLVERSAALMSDPATRRRFADRALATIRPYDWQVLGPRYAAELYGGSDWPTA